MSKYFLFGTSSSNRLRNMTPKRMAEMRHLISRGGGALCGSYALPGRYDVILITEFENQTAAIRTATALEHLTGIAFNTNKAIPLTIFEAMLDEMTTEIESERMEAHE